MTHDKQLEALRKNLRAKLRGDADVAVGAAELRRVLDELGRLQQSNDRLRRQNRRMRLRLQRAGVADEEGQDAQDVPGDGQPDASDVSDGGGAGDVTDGGD